MRYPVLGQLSKVEAWRATLAQVQPAQIPDSWKSPLLNGKFVTLPLFAALAAVLWHVIARRWFASRQIPSPLPWNSDLAHHASKGCRPDYCDLHDRYGPLFWWRMWRLPILMIGGQEAVKTVLLSEHTAVESAYPPTVKLVLGPYAVANVYGNKHKALRKMLGSAFNLRIIHQGLGTMVSLAETTLSEWASRTSSSAFDEGRRYALRVLIHAMVGNDENWTSHEAFNERNETFEVWRKGLFCAPIPIPGTTFWRAMVARQQLLRTIRKSLDRHDSAKDVHKEGVLQSLLNAEDEHAGKLPRRALEDIFLNFVFAGQDTSAATLCQLLRFLAAHPKAMQALRDEQHIVRQKHGEEISVAALNDMKLAEATIKETLRLAPVVPQAPRIALRQFMLAGHKIYPGTLLQAGIAHATMTDPQWKDDSPHLFMPERWLKNVDTNKTLNAKNRTELRRATKEAGWLAFGGGARICPGKRLTMAELTIFAAVLARSYNFEILDHQEGWEQFPLMRPRNGMPIRISALSV